MVVALSIRTASSEKGTFTSKRALSNFFPSKEPSEISKAYLATPRSLQFWASAMVILPVFLQAPWVHVSPFSACLFTFVLLGFGFALVQFGGNKWGVAGSLLVGVSGSWLGGCLFWGWLRAHPVLHLPVEAIASPLAFVGLATRWRVGAGFYLSCLLGTAFTDLVMVLTGVMHSWPAVVSASLDTAPLILHETAQALLNPQSILLVLIAAGLIGLLAHLMKERATLNSTSGSTWLVASAALFTTLWIDGLFLLTALVEPKLSGLI